MLLSRLKQETECNEKSVCAYWFSFAITLIVLNLFSIKAALVILAITGAAFAVSFALKKTRQVISVALCMFSAFLACAVFITTYYGTLLPCEKLNETTAYSEFYIVDLEQETSSGYSYTVKTVSVDKVLLRISGCM